MSAALGPSCRSVITNALNQLGSGNEAAGRGEEMQTKCALAPEEPLWKCGCLGDWNTREANRWFYLLNMGPVQGCACVDDDGCGACFNAVIKELYGRQLRKVLWRGAGHDVKITSRGGSTHWAHWLALGCCGCNYFSDLREEILKRGRVANEICIDLSDETIRALLGWVYHRELLWAATPDNVTVLCELLEFAYLHEMLLLQYDVYVWLSRADLPNRTLLRLLAKSHHLPSKEVFKFCAALIVFRKARGRFSSGRTVATDSNDLNTADRGDLADEALAFDPAGRLAVQSVLAVVEFVPQLPKEVLSRPSLCVADDRGVDPITLEHDPLSNADEMRLNNTTSVLAHLNFGPLPRVDKNPDLAATSAAHRKFWAMCRHEIFTVRRDFPREKIDEFADVSLIALEDNVEFRGYHGILVAASPAFATILSDDGAHSLLLKEESSIVRLLLEWINSRVLGFVHLEALQRVYALAKVHEVWGLTMYLESKAADRTLCELLSGEEFFALLRRDTPANSPLKPDGLPNELTSSTSTAASALMSMTVPSRLSSSRLAWRRATASMSSAAAPRRVQQPLQRARPDKPESGASGPFDCATSTTETPAAKKYSSDCSRGDAESTMEAAWKVIGG